MSRQRSEAFKRASISNKEADWEKYYNLDIQVRKMIRDAKKKRRARNERRNMRWEKENNVRWAKKAIRYGKKDKTRQSVSGTLKPELFTTHIAKEEGKAQVPPVHVFHCDNEFGALMTNAIRTAPKGKLAGPDELFVDAFQTSPNLVSKLLCRIWEHSSKLNYVLKKWQIAIYIPVHKKDDPTHPRNYRPITVMLHARKMVEAAIAKAIRKRYTFDNEQLGFQHETGRKTAVVRYTAKGQGLHITAVQDLKWSYLSMPRTH